MKRDDKKRRTYVHVNENPEKSFFSYSQFFFFCEKCENKEVRATMDDCQSHNNEISKAKLCSTEKTALK